MSVAKTRFIGLAEDVAGLTITESSGTVPHLTASDTVERNSFGAGNEASDTPPFCRWRGAVPSVSIHATVVLKEIPSVMKMLGLVCYHRA
jgi:hypothetical protein